jgi:GTP-binding protein EngB required for normal cell division
MYEKFDLVKKEQQKEAQERRKKEEKQFEELKKLIQSNPAEATKMPKLSASSSFHPYALSTSTNAQGEPNSVFAEKTYETLRDSQDMTRNIQQDSVMNQPIKLVENQMIGTIDVIIENTNNSKNIAVIGLPKTGRSTLVGALAGGIWPKNLSQNPMNTKYGKIYKLNYPNNGFIDGSVNENRPIYEEFFQNAKLSNLSTLIITIDGSVREEDYLVLSLAQKYCIPAVIARTKLDEWLDNRPKDQSKEDYVKDDKKYVIESLQKLGINFSQNNIFNISALSTIIIAEEGSQSDMFQYLQDEQSLLSMLQFEDNKNVVLLNEKQQPDVVILGLSGAGKSTIMDGLLSLHLMGNDKIKKINYDETMPTEDVLKQLENICAKIYLIVVANTVGKMDANLVENFVKTGKNFAILLSKSDEIIGNLKKQQTFVCVEDYVHDRHEAANIEFQKLVCTNIPMFAISGYKLTGFVEDSVEEESFLNFLKQFL